MTRNMQKRQNEAIQCRFCLSEKIDSKNPFITPCDCKGTIEFVHLYCLNVWRNKNIERNYTTCSLCHSNYRIPLEYSIEQIPKVSLLFIVVDHPILTNLTINYIWMIYAGILMNQKNIDIMTSYGRCQLVYHLYYIVSMAKYFKVIKKQRYYAAWKQEDRLYFFPFYFFLVFTAACSSDSFTWFIPSIFLTMFWNIHTQILDQMNTEDLQVPSQDD
jgi:E3 ubiquitin-protein ligase DOA10